MIRQVKAAFPVLLLQFLSSEIKGMSIIRANESDGYIVVDDNNLMPGLFFYQV